MIWLGWYVVAIVRSRSFSYRISEVLICEIGCAVPDLYRDLQPVYSSSSQSPWSSVLRSIMDSHDLAERGAGKTLE